MVTFISDKKDKVLEFFLLNPTKEMHLRELARELDISHPWIKKNIEELEKENVVQIRKKHSVLLVKAKQSKKFIAFKRSYNLFSLYKSGLVKELKKTYNDPEAIILFGSYCFGEDTEESDIDVAIITKRRAKIKIRKYEKQLQRKLKILRLSVDKIHNEFKTTLANGIVLHGYLEI